MPSPPWRTTTKCQFRLFLCHLLKLLARWYKIWKRCIVFGFTTSCIISQVGWHPSLIPVTAAAAGLLVRTSCSSIFGLRCRIWIWDVLRCEGLNLKYNINPKPIYYFSWNWENLSIGAIATFCWQRVITAMLTSQKCDFGCIIGHRAT